MTDRQTKILEIVNQKKKVEVATLSQMLEVSQVTIRKDLDALEELNFLTREHGYATMKNMSDIGNRMAFCYETKQRIAEKASEIISDGETIMVESGSSCALLVKYLSETKKDITVITNSSYIARFIRETEGGVTKVIVLGGEYQKEAEVMVGPLVKTCAEAFYVDKLFMGTDGYIPGIGFTSGDMLRAEAAKSMADSARNSIILTDSSKFSEHGVVMQCRLKDINMVFTDDQVPLEAKDAMEQNGIIVETVPRKGRNDNRNCHMNGRKIRMAVFVFTVKTLSLLCTKINT